MDDARESAPRLPLTFDQLPPWWPPDLPPGKLTHHRRQRLQAQRAIIERLLADLRVRMNGRSQESGRPEAE
jgi:hypothetical protein